MHTKIKLYLPVIAALILFSQCKKETGTYSAHFYTDKGISDQPLTLFIDGNSKGILPYLTNHPNCQSDSLNQRTLSLPLTSGKHLLEARDASGQLISSSTIKFRCNSVSCSGTVGGSESSSQGECLVVGLFP